MLSALELELMELVRAKLAEPAFVSVLKTPFQLVDGRLYFATKTRKLDLDCYLMVDPASNRIKTVYDLSGSLDRNFTPHPEQISELIATLSKE